MRASNQNLPKKKKAKSNEPLRGTSKFLFVLRFCHFIIVMNNGRHILLVRGKSNIYRKKEQS